MLLPLAGAAIISALPKASEKAAKQAALGTTLVVMERQLRWQLDLSATMWSCSS